MNCSEAEVYVSAVNDGEKIPREFAAHISGCAECRRALADYSRIGAELRLLSMNQPTSLSPLPLPTRRGRLAFLWKRVVVPQFALVGLVACATIAIATSSIVRAQSRPLWFEFSYSTDDGFRSPYFVAKDGFDLPSTAMYLNSGTFVATKFRIKIESISMDDVVIRVRAVPAAAETMATGAKLQAGQLESVSLDGVARVHYKPGESLPVSVEGGGTLYLKGDVLDHQPKIAFGSPLEPGTAKMNVRSPALIESGKLIGDFYGASSSVDATDQAVFLTLSDRVFAFALQPFPGAVEARAEWGQISFELDGTAYRLVAAAPITGGDQPRQVWVRVAERPDWGPHCDHACLSQGLVPK